MELTKRAQMRRAINNYKKKLADKASVSGVYENFGQKEIRAIKEKYGDEVTRVSEFRAFMQWCETYTAI